MAALIPADVLSALGRLNAHARLRSAFSTEREAIYAYKELVAHMLAAAEVAQLRFVALETDCTCEKGRYCDRDGEWQRCRYCEGTGRKTLRFTETTLPDGQVWHHPWDGRTGPGRDLAYAIGCTLDGHGIWRNAGGIALEWRDPGDWRPRTPGLRLALAELVTLINLVEDWVEALPEQHWAPGVRDYWKWQHASNCLHQVGHSRIAGPNSHAYKLDLGRAPGGCFACGATDDLAGYHYGRCTSLFHWSLPVCCRHGEGPEKVPHPDGPPPDALIIPPVRQWLARHERVVEAA